MFRVFRCKLILKKKNTVKHTLNVFTGRNKEKNKHFFLGLDKKRFWMIYDRCICNEFLLFFLSPKRKWKFSINRQWNLRFARIIWQCFTSDWNWPLQEMNVEWNNLTLSASFILTLIPHTGFCDLQMPHRFLFSSACWRSLIATRCELKSEAEIDTTTHSYHALGNVREMERKRKQ